MRSQSRDSSLYFGGRHTKNTCNASLWLCGWQCFCFWSLYVLHEALCFASSFVCSLSLSSVFYWASLLARIYVRLPIPSLTSSILHWIRRLWSQVLLFFSECSAARKQKFSNALSTSSAQWRGVSERTVNRVSGCSHCFECSVASIGPTSFVKTRDVFRSHA